MAPTMKLDQMIDVIFGLFPTDVRFYVQFHSLVFLSAVADFRMSIKGGDFPMLMNYMSLAGDY